MRCYSARAVINQMFYIYKKKNKKGFHRIVKLSRSQFRRYTLGDFQYRQVRKKPALIRQVPNEWTTDRPTDSKYAIDMYDNFSWYRRQ